MIGTTNRLESVGFGLKSNMVFGKKVNLKIPSLSTRIKLLGHFFEKFNICHKKIDVLKLNGNQDPETV